MSRLKATDFPRILLVSGSVFNTQTGGGITLTNLFRGWPSDRIAVAHTDPFPVDEEVCRQFYRLSEDEFQWMWPISIVRDWYIKHQAYEFESPSENSGQGKTELLEENKSGGGLSLVRKLRDRIIGDGFPLQVCVTDRLQAWVQAFKPDLIYTLLGTLPYIQMTRQLADRFRIPVAIHMMDDWPRTLHKRGLFGFYLRRKMHREFEAVLNNAALRMSICEFMSRAYESRYGYPFLSFHNPVDFQAWQSWRRRSWSAGSPFRIVYSGAILAKAQDRSLVEVCDAVAELQAEGMKVELHLHCPHFFAAQYRAEMERLPAVRMYGPPTNDTLPRLFSEADLLVLPANFDSESVAYIRYSHPTKIPAYKISGTPILVYGPEDVGYVCEAREMGWGYVVSQRSAKALKAAIKHLATDLELRERLGRRAQEVAADYHDVAKVKPAFWQALIDAAATPVSP